MSKKSQKKQARKELINKVVHNVSVREDKIGYFCGAKLLKKTPDNYEW